MHGMKMVHAVPITRITLRAFDVALFTKSFYSSTETPPPHQKPAKSNWTRLTAPDPTQTVPNPAELHPILLFVYFSH